ncbi:hypothetical protein F0562_003419 [Nyssa sinensis]|uniref:Uncharacterized protein n=1 Tax=Nyssa sinensis TaxID=561372 RepID=A0A5J5BYH1_9ASTE|nr:hypothetical protein F0562_003419 [Nyssa sinensis]
MVVFGPRVDRGWGFCGWVDGESYGRLVKFLWLNRSVGLFESSSSAEDVAVFVMNWIADSVMAVVGFIDPVVSVFGGNACVRLVRCKIGDGDDDANSDQVHWAALDKLGGR